MSCKRYEKCGNPDCRDGHAERPGGLNDGGEPMGPEVMECRDCQGTGMGCAGGEPVVCEDCCGNGTVCGEKYIRLHIRESLTCTTCSGSGDLCPTCHKPVPPKPDVADRCGK